MRSKGMGGNLGGEAQRRGRGGLSVLVAAVACLIAVSSVAYAQTCPTAPCSTNANCDDGVFCTLDQCISAPGGFCICSHSDGQCEDGLFCNGIGYCDTGTDSCQITPTNCQAPTPYCNEGTNSCVECLQSSDCTVDPRRTCSGGRCVQCTGHAACQDGSFCNGLETCNFSTGLCQAGTPQTCPRTCFMGTPPNPNVCDTDAQCPGGRCVGYCNDTRATCVQCKIDADCDDGKFCNGAETCENDQCVVNPPPVCKKCVGGSQQGQPCITNAECPGSPPGTCTGDPSYCDETSNRCVECLNPAHCEDFNFCTTNACVGYPFNSCDFPTNRAICSDGLWCNGEEVCTWADGNPCSIFSDRAHCCSAGTPRNCADSVTCTVDSCNETIERCQYTPNNTLCPGSNLGCNGTETCQPGALGADPASGCVAGTPIDCTSFNTFCSTGTCVETPSPPHCQAQGIRQGLACDDDNPCTAISKCNNGFCVDNPPASNDPWRCVRLEWRASGPTTVLAGATVQLGLYAVASGCNTPHESNMRCIGGAANGNTCTTNANCRVCVGGTVPGTECTTNATCQGNGTCPAGGTCTDLCPSTSLPISTIDALVSWNKTFLQLNPSTGPDPNPQDACVQPTACTACPIDTYNWSGTGGFSGWFNDCSGDALNEPCNPGVPSLNDGNALYLAFQGPNQSCPDGCATTAGLKISTIKFKAISGGTSSIALLPCFGADSKTQVTSPLVWEGVPTSDVTKSLGPAITIIVTCDSHDDCNDNNACTDDTCTGGTCLHADNTNTCDDSLFCTTNDRCSSGQCQGGAPTCLTCLGGWDAGKPCYTTAQCEFPGTCTGGPSLCEEVNDRCVQCLSAANCNDGLGGTVDTCVDGVCVNTPIDCNDNVACTIDETVEPSGTCTNTPDNAFCNPTNSFCSAAICDPLQGCVFDHECISLDGNPCPDPTTCNEGSRTCGGCEQPTTVAAGCRYLAVTPAEQGSTPVALIVTGDCSNPNAACVYQFVQSKCVGGPNNGLDCFTDADCPKRCAGGTNNGNPCTTNADCPPSTVGTCAGTCDTSTLGAAPFYKPASEWGTPKIRGKQIRPNTKYMVHEDCNFAGGAVLSSAASATTWKWGDTDGDSDADGLDISRVIDAFKGFIGGALTFEQVNLWGCAPDDRIDALDISSVIDAFKGFAYSCVITCP